MSAVQCDLSFKGGLFTKKHWFSYFTSRQR
jgi:hypothetical protein